MGSDNRDWYQEPDQPRRRFFDRVSTLVLVLVVLIAIVVIKSPWQLGSDRSGAEQSVAGDLKLSILPGLPSLTIRKGSLYPKNDLWKSYLASEETCPGGERTNLPPGQQADVMVCLINFARQARGLSTLSIFPLLNETSLSKAEKIVRCNDFDHDACGFPPDADARDAGYRGFWGENLYLGENRLGSPRVALDGWLNSVEHRENLFRPEWRSQGIAVMKVAKLGNYSEVSIWVNQFAMS